MKVLFLIGSVGMGGHTRSALAIGRALATRGVGVHIAAGEGKGIALMKESGLPYSILPTGFRRGYVLDRRTFRAAAQVMDEICPDVCHAFDFNGLMLGERQARRNHRKLVFTICGGPVPRAQVPTMRPLVVFSSELKNGLLERQGFRGENILIHAGRIELGHNVHPPERIANFKREIGVIEGVPVILMISRVASSKLPALLHLVKTADCITGQNSGQFLIVGAADEPHSLAILLQAISLVNEKHGRTVIMWTDRESELASRLLPLATIAVGVGRSAFEAMNLGLPTLVIGNHGFSAVASEETCAVLMEKNFSGRDALDRPGEDASPKKTAEAVCRLLDDRSLAERIGREGQRWIIEHLSAEKGAEFYAHLYSREDDFFQLPDRSKLFRLYAETAAFRIYNQLCPLHLKKFVSRLRHDDLLSGFDF